MSPWHGSPLMVHFLRDDVRLLCRQCVKLDPMPNVMSTTMLSWKRRSSSSSFYFSHDSFQLIPLLLVWGEDVQVKSSVVRNDVEKLLHFKHMMMHDDAWLQLRNLKTRVMLPGVPGILKNNGRVFESRVSSSCWFVPYCSMLGLWNRMRSVSTLLCSTRFTQIL